MRSLTHALDRVLLLSLFVAFQLPGCTPNPNAKVDSESAQSAVAITGGTLLIHLEADVDSWNPYTTKTASSANIIELLYPRLVREGGGADGTGFEPWLAESWNLSDNGLDLTFLLRADARWSDGSPVTCDDVRFTWRAQLSQELAWTGVGYKKRIRDVECTGPHEAIFHFTEVYADQMLDANDNAIVAQAYADVPFDAWRATSWEDRLLSCGPFRLSAVEPGQQSVLERDPHWWGEPAHVDRVIFRTHPDAAQGMFALEAGELDVFVGVDPLRAPALQQADSVRLQVVPSRAYTFLGWNQLEPQAYAEDRRRRDCGEGCDETAAQFERLRKEHPHPILSDRRVRVALSRAIDREDLIDGLWSGFAAPGATPIVSSLWAAIDDLQLPLDPVGADRLLDEAGWSDRAPDGVRVRDGNRLELRVLAYADNATRMDALHRVVANLERHGVRLIAEPVSRGEFIRRAWDKDFDGVISSWRAGTRVEPQTLLHSDAALDRGNNFIGWSTPVSDDLLERAAAAESRAAAGPLWEEWQRLFHEEQPYAILYERQTILGLNSRVQGAVPTPFNPLDRLDRWWIDPQAASAEPPG